MTVARIVEADAIVSLERISAQAIAEGRVVLIALDAVRDALADRWTRKREQVWSHADIHIARHMNPGDLAQRVSDTEYLLAFPGREPAAAQGVALQTLGEILTFFLGKVEPRSLQVSTVRDLSHGRISASALSPEQIAALLGSAPLEIATKSLPTPIGTWLRTPIRLGSGLEVSLTSWTESVTHVRAQRRIGARLARQVTSPEGRLLTPSERDRLEPLELAELDTATLATARGGLARERRAGGLALLPVSFPAFANAQARLRLLQALAGLSREERGALVLEVEDLAPGVPASRIVEAFGFIRPFARAVMVRSSTARMAVEALRNARVQGLALDAAGLDGKPGEVFGRLKLLRERSQGIAPDILALGLPSPALAPLAVAAGASWYSVRPDADALAQTG